jgi:hypothetical protein
MATGRHDELLEHLHNRAESGLRTVTYYDADAIDILYARDDVRAELSGDQAGGIIEHLREREGIQAAKNRLGFDDTLVCSVHCWDNHIGLHFSHGPQSGTLVTLDAEVARDLHAFVSECRSTLTDDSPADKAR